MIGAQLTRAEVIRIFAAHCAAQEVPGPAATPVDLQLHAQEILRQTEATITALRNSQLWADVTPLSTEGDADF